MSKILNLKEYVIARTFSPWQSHEIASHSFAMTEQRGRSMVEMLGVLAVIGVLSVAGIAGYSTAMNQYRANEAINRAMTLAVMLSAQRLVNPNATLSESDLGSGLSVGNDTNNIVLTISDVPDKVRSRIEAMGLKNAEISVSGENITFTFNNDLSERSGSSSNSGTNQQQASCTEDPSLCLHGSGCSESGICNCWGTGYDGDRCQNQVIINKNNFTGEGGNCPVGIFGKTYCKNVAGGCQSWECAEALEGCQWESDGEPQPGTCENKSYCDWIEE